MAITAQQIGTHYVLMDREKMHIEARLTYLLMSQVPERLPEGTEVKITAISSTEPRAVYVRQSSNGRVYGPTYSYPEVLFEAWFIPMKNGKRKRR